MSLYICRYMYVSICAQVYVCLCMYVGIWMQEYVGLLRRQEYVGLGFRVCSDGNVAVCL
jgi:hypothetical protein